MSALVFRYCLSGQSACIKCSCWGSHARTAYQYWAGECFGSEVEQFHTAKCVAHQGSCHQCWRAKCKDKIFNRVNCLPQGKAWHFFDFVNAK